MLRKCQDYATRRRLEKMHHKGGDDMDVDDIEEELFHEAEAGDGWWIDEDVESNRFEGLELDYVNKGRVN